MNTEHYFHLKTRFWPEFLSLFWNKIVDYLWPCNVFQIIQSHGWRVFIIHSQKRRMPFKKPVGLLNKLEASKPNSRSISNVLRPVFSSYSIGRISRVLVYSFQNRLHCHRWWKGLANLIDLVLAISMASRIVLVLLSVMFPIYLRFQTLQVILKGEQLAVCFWYRIMNYSASQVTSYIVQMVEMNPCELL